MHAELRYGDGMVMLGRPGPSWGMKTAKELGAVSGGIYSIVDDGIDAHYERAVAAGAEVAMELQTPTTAHASTWSGIPRGTSGASAPTGASEASRLAVEETFDHPPRPSRDPAVLVAQLARRRTQ